MNKNLSEKQFYYKLATEKSTMTVQLLAIDFACRVIRLYIHLTENEMEYVLSKQILRSGTSIGANIMESQHSQSAADFLSKMNIALKEAEETKYWLLLFFYNGYLSEKQSNSLLNDCDRIIRILLSIVSTTARNIKKKKKKNKK